MDDKVWLVRSFAAGAVSAPLLLWALLFASSLSAAGGLPLTIVSMPFLDFTAPSGRKVSITGIWFWIMIALIGGASFTLVAGLLRTILHSERRA